MSDMCGFFNVWDLRSPNALWLRSETVEYKGWPFGWLRFDFRDDEDTGACYMFMLHKFW
jgi:hypothetical protein